MQQKKYFARSRKRKRTGEPDTNVILRDFIPSYIQSLPAKEAPQSQPLAVPRQSKTNRHPTIIATQSSVSSGDNSRRNITMSSRQGLANLDSKRKRLLNVQNWAGLPDAPAADPQQTLDQSDEESEKHQRRAWSQNKKRDRSQLPHTRLPRHSSLTTVRIGSQTYQWSPERSSNKVKNGNSISSSQTSANTARRLLISPKSHYHFSASKKTISGRRKQQLTPDTASQTRVRSHGENTQQMSEAFDKPQLIVISSPQLIFHPQPATRLGRRPAESVSQPAHRTANDDCATGSTDEPYQDATHNMDPSREDIYNDRPDATEVQNDSCHIVCLSEQSSQMSRCVLPVQGRNDVVVTPNKRPEQEQVIDMQECEAPEKEVGQPAVLTEDEEDQRWREFMQGDEDFLEMSQQAVHQHAQPFAEQDETARPDAAVFISVPCSETNDEVKDFRVASSPSQDPMELTQNHIAQVLGTEGEMVVGENVAAMAAEGVGFGTPSSICLTRALSPERTTTSRFHKPRLFVGRLASNTLALEGGTMSSAQNPPKSRRRRGKQKRRNGIDIRSVPNFNDDPIEED